MRYGKLRLDDFIKLHQLSAIKVSRYTKDEKASIKSIVECYPAEGDNDKNSALHALIIYLENFARSSSLDEIESGVEKIFDPLLWAMQGNLDVRNAKGYTALRMLFLSNLPGYYKFKIALNFLDAGASLAYGIECENSRQLCKRSFMIHSNTTETSLEQRLFMICTNTIEASLEHLSFKFKVFSHPAFVQLLLKQSDWFIFKQDKDLLQSIENSTPLRLQYTSEAAKEYIDNELVALSNIAPQKQDVQETSDMYIKGLEREDNKYITLFISCIAFNSKFISYPVSYIIAKLQEMEVDLNTKFSFYDNGTALHIAVICQNYEAINALLGAGVKINAEDKHKIIPLHIACYLGDLKIVQKLIKAGTRLNAQSEDEYTPLIMATWFGYLEIMQSLIKAGADVSICRFAQNNALHDAARKNQVEAVKLLIARGLDVNSRNVDGQTALIIASKLGNYSTVSYLVKVEGIDLNICDSYDCNALHNAIKSSQPEIAKLLLHFSIDTEAKSIYGTALDMASKNYYNNNLIDAIKRIQDNRKKNSAQYSLNTSVIQIQEGVEALPVSESKPCVHK